MEKKDYIVAIDLGSSNVVVAVGSKNADGKLEVDDIAVRPAEGVVRGEIKNIEQASKSIKEAIEEVEDRLGIKITEAYTGISGQHIKCAANSYHVYVGRDGEIRAEDVSKLRDSMRNVQAPVGECILDFIPQYYVVDGEEQVADPVGMFGQKLEATFNFILGEANAISRLEKALMKVDVRQAQLLINPLVTADAVVLPDEKELGVAVVDMGAGTTDICIYHDKVARHIGVVPLGADMINKDIRAYGILERYIEELKVKYGSAVSNNASQEKHIKVPGRTPREPKEISFYNLAGIIEARMMDIIEYVMAEIRRSGYEGKLGAGLVLTGGCAQLKDIDLLVKAQTGLDVRIASPNLHVAEESQELAADTRLATAIGILLKGVQSGKASRVESVRRIPTPAPQQQQPYSPPRQETPVLPMEERPEETGAQTDEAEQHGKKKDKKKNLLTNFIDKLTKPFDIIDDNDI